MFPNDFTRFLIDGCRQFEHFRALFKAEEGRDRVFSQFYCAYRLVNVPHKQAIESVRDVLDRTLKRNPLAEAQILVKRPDRNNRNNQYILGRLDQLPTCHLLHSSLSLADP